MGVGCRMGAGLRHVERFESSIALRRSGSLQNSRCRHCRRCYLPCGSGRVTTNPGEATTSLEHRARTDACSRKERPPIHSDDPWLLPYLNCFAPTGRTPPALKRECHLGKPKAELPIRIANVRTVDMISVTPVRVWAVVPCRESLDTVRSACASTIVLQPVSISASRFVRSHCRTAADDRPEARHNPHHPRRRRGRIVRTHRLRPMAVANRPGSGRHSDPVLLSGVVPAGGARPADRAQGRTARDRRQAGRAEKR